MRLLLILFVSSCVHTTIAECGVEIYSNDPKPWGGAPCASHDDCGGVNAGRCNGVFGTDDIIVNGTCECHTSRGNPDCSYERYSRNLVGGLNIGLSFIGGIGNFIIQRTGIGAGQLILTVIGGIMSCMVGFCIFFGINKNECDDMCFLFGGMRTVYCIGVFFLLVFLAGFIWSIVDGALMLTCNLADINGYALYR